MKFYIASKYIENHSINTKIYNALIDKGYEVFLPKSINIDAKTDKEMYQVAEICYDEIDNTDIFLAVFPFGWSVSAEIGYAIKIKREKNRKMRIMLFDNNSDTENMEKLLQEAMISPYFEPDLNVSSIEELMDILKKINCDV